MNIFISTESFYYTGSIYNVQKHNFMIGIYEKI